MFWQNWRTPTLRFGCNQCGECCRQMEVPLNHADLARLQEARPEIPLQQLVRLLPAEATDPDSVWLENGWQTLCLAHGGPERGCYFLADNQCSLYEARPSACKNWPLALNSQAQPEVHPAHRLLWELACEKTPQRNLTTFKRNLRANIAEFAEYRLRIQHWNQWVRSPESRVEANLDNFWQFLRRSEQAKAES